MSLLQRPEPDITHTGKRKRQRKPNVPAIPRQPDLLPDRPDEPHLRHAHDGAEDAEAERQDGGDAGREERGGHVDGGVVAGEAAFEDEVLGEGDGFVDGEPVALWKAVSGMVDGGGDEGRAQ